MDRDDNSALLRRFYEFLGIELEEAFGVFFSEPTSGHHEKVRENDAWVCH
jgi:hypothetical protein